MSQLPTDNDSGLCLTPNQHARPSGHCLGPESVELFGYQEFMATAGSLTVSPVDSALARKARLLASVLRPSRLAGRSVLDMGANNGYFSLAALQQGASQVKAVDLDPQCIVNLNAIRSHLRLERLTVLSANVVDVREPADCVFALALSHWLCACTAALGSLDAVISHLAGLTRYLLVVEFVEVKDDSVRTFGHLTWGGRTTTGYSKDAFESSLRRHFIRVQPLGQMSQSRLLYAAYKTAMDVDLSGPLNLRFSTDQLLSCRFLATVAGEAMWSAVFDLGDRIVKQTTGSFALHEARVLQLLNGRLGGGFPKVLGTERGEDWSTVTLERIDGVPLAEAASTIASNRCEFVRFTNACLDLLAAMRSLGIVHRDIHARNVLVCDGRPVLMDFGWAVAPGIDIEAPPGILTWRQAMDEPDATPEHCDVRSMGRLLLDMSVGRHADLEALFGVMAEPAVSLRVQDPELLQEWLARIDSSHLRPDLQVSGTRRLLSLAEGRRRRVRQLTVAASRTDRAYREANARLKELDSTASDLHARLEAALERGGHLHGLSEAEWLHLLTYVHGLCHFGLAGRASSVASCVSRSLGPDHPVSAVFSHIYRSIEALRLSDSRALEPNQIDGREIISRAACEIARFSRGSTGQTEAERCVRHCLSLSRGKLMTRRHPNVAS